MSGASAACQLEVLAKKISPSVCLNVILAGRGGQGVILAGQLLLRSCLLQGLVVKRSEVHGMAQRGGSVLVHVRMGEKVASPVIPEGQTHFILGIDTAEGQRWLEQLSPLGQLIMLTAAERKQLPSPRFVNMAILGKFLAALQQENRLLQGLESVLQALVHAELEAGLREKMPPLFVRANIQVFNTYLMLKRKV